MNAKRERPPIKKSRLENEVILAVVVLYVLLSGALLVIHHVQPEDAETETSSTSPSHGHFSTGATDGAAAPDAPELTQPQAHALLVRDSYQEIRGLRRDGDLYRATAIKAGKAWQVEVDATTHAIAATPAPTH